MNDRLFDDPEYTVWANAVSAEVDGMMDRDAIFSEIIQIAEDMWVPGAHIPSFTAVSRAFVEMMGWGYDQIVAYPKGFWDKMRNDFDRYFIRKLWRPLELIELGEQYDGDWSRSLMHYTEMNGFQLSDIPSLTVKSTRWKFESYFTNERRMK